MYLDSAYLAKYYVNEPDAVAVRELIRGAALICSSSLAVVEATCTLRRHVREGSLTVAEGQELINLFRSHVDRGVWALLPISERLLLRTVLLAEGLPAHVPLRAGDAIHLATALDAGEPEIWTNDRHLLAAAAHVGIVGRTAKAAL